MEDFIRECGFDDLFTVDQNGVVISGIRPLGTMADIGPEDPSVVQSDGSRPIVHERGDPDLEKDTGAKRLALFQNRVGEVNSEWNPEVLKELQGDGDLLKGLWSDKELARSRGRRRLTKARHRRGRGGHGLSGFMAPLTARALAHRYSPALRADLILPAWGEAKRSALAK